MVYEQMPASTSNHLNAPDRTADVNLGGQLVMAHDTLVNVRRFVEPH